MSKNVYKSFYEEFYESTEEAIENIENFVKEYSEMPSKQEISEYSVDNGLGIGSAYFKILTDRLSLAVNNYVQNAHEFSDAIESKIDDILETGGDAFDISKKIDVLINYYGNKDSFILELVQNLDQNNSLKNIEIPVSCYDVSISATFFINKQKVTDAGDIKNAISDILIKSEEFYNVLKTEIDNLMEENKLTLKKQKSLQP